MACLTKGNRKKPWRARIMVQGYQYLIGYYNTEQKAIAAEDKARAMILTRGYTVVGGKRIPPLMNHSALSLKRSSVGIPTPKANEGETAGQEAG